MSNNTQFKPGDKVVYPSHGVGVVAELINDVVAGFQIQMYSIKFEKDEMILKVPVKRAESSGLRHLSSGKKIEKAIAVLKGRAKVGRGMWSRRAQEYEQKINSGNVLFVAEVVRDLHKNVDDPDRSYSERVIYESALNRLAGEYCAVYSITVDKAVAELTDILRAQRAKAKKVVAIDDAEEESAFDEQDQLEAQAA